MLGGIGFGRNKKKKKFINSYKGREDVMGHDRLQPEETQHIKEK